jgi:hypothetical protein
MHTVSLPERDPQVEPMASPNPRVTTGPLLGSCRNHQARKLPRLVLTLASRALVYGPTLPPCVPPPLFTVALAGTMPARITGGALLATKMVGRRPPLPPPPAPGGGVSKGLWLPRKPAHFLFTRFPPILSLSYTFSLTFSCPDLVEESAHSHPAQPQSHLGFCYP